MPWLPIANTVPQYHVGGEPAAGYVLKFYEDGTTTNTVMATDDTGGTTLNDVVLDSQGYPSNSGIFIPHIDQEYKLALYPTQAAADADTGAVWTIDSLSAPIIAGANTDINAKVSSNDTTTGYLNGKLTAGDGISLTEGSDGANETLAIATTAKLTLGTEQATTSGTEIDFTSIPSWVQKITLLWEGVSLSGTATFHLQIGDSGGIETSGYTGGGQRLEFVGATVTNVSAGGGAAIAFGEGNASYVYHGAINLYLKDATNNTWVVDGRLVNGNVIWWLDGYKSLSDTLDRVRITTSNGTDTFDAGSMNIQYS